MEPEPSYPSNPVHRRIEYLSVLGTVLYFGPLKHKEEIPQQLWLGIEWDDETRGKHNGTIENFSYFHTKNNKNSGSLLKVERANFGIELLDGLLLKYFKEDPFSLKKQLLQELQKQAGTFEEKKNDEKAQEKPPISIEYDEEAYFETIRKHKKKVEFIGFDRIWKKINNLKEIQEISLQDLQISTIGLPNTLRSILPNLRILSLEKNLLFDFQQVLHLGYEFPLLESLSLSYNRLLPPAKPLHKYEEIDVFLNNSSVPALKLQAQAFPCLKTLILVEMGLTWSVLQRILCSFPVLEELILCRNQLNDFENLTVSPEEMTPKLRFLNLEENAIADFAGIAKFSKLQELEKLTLSKNFLQNFGEVSGFAKVSTVSIEHNLFEDAIILHELSQFENLKSLRLKENPMIAKYGAPYIRQRAVAENVKLVTINGSDLKKYERKDCEIFYLRKTFEEFFKASNSFYYQYDFEDFLNNFCKKDHPAINRLLKIYGNPFEMDPDAKNSKAEQPILQKNVMLTLKISALTGPLVGKEPIKKKFPDSTIIVNLKAVLAKLLTVSAENMMILYRNANNAGEPMEVLEEDLKSLAYYNVSNGGEIFVEEKN